MTGATGAEEPINYEFGIIRNPFRNDRIEAETVSAGTRILWVQVLVQTRGL